MKVANRDARHEVESRRNFRGANTYGENVTVNHNEMYVVYSYGKHFPLFLWIEGQWYENQDRYSVSTSRHKSQLRPLAGVSRILVATRDLQRMIESGRTLVAGGVNPAMGW